MTRDDTDLSAPNLQALTEELDILAAAHSWLSDGMRTYFALGGTLYLLDLAKQSISQSPFGIASGFAWNNFDAVGGAVSVAHKINHFDEVKANFARKKVEIATEAVLCTQLFSLNTVSMVVQHGHIRSASVATVKTLGTLGSYAFAACMWGAAAVESAALERARKKTNMHYLLQDRMRKYAKQSDKIARVKQTVDTLEAALAQLDKKSPVFSKKQQRLQKHLRQLDKKWIVQRRLEQQIRCLHKETTLGESASEIDNPLVYSGDIARLFLQDSDYRQKIGLALKASQHDEEAACETMTRDIDDDSMTKQDQALINFLKRKQAEKVRQKSISVAAWYTAAVGMTLLAIAPLSGPVAPALLVLGKLLTVIAGVIKSYEVIQYTVLNKIAVYRQQKKVRAQIEQHVKGEQLLMVPTTISEAKGFCCFKRVSERHLSAKERVQYRLLFDLCRADYLANNPEFTDKSEQVLQESFYHKLQSMSKSKRNTLLQAAMHKTVEDRILKDSLGLIDTCALSDNDRVCAIAQASRDQLSRDTKQWISNKARFFNQQRQDQGDKSLVTELSLGIGG